ncbi:hypothetical protein D3C72_1790650 [compost metagenome]
MNLSWLSEGIVLAVITGVGTWFAARKKNIADVNRTEIENSDLVNGVLQKNVQMLQSQVSELLGVVQELRRENLKLNRTIYDLQKEILSLKSFNDKLPKNEKQNLTATDPVSITQQLQDTQTEMPG